MEARKVIIVNNKTQSQKTIMSNATTLGELKAEATAAGVNIEGMTWYEGHMRAELKDDASPLPATVMWRGTETTDLTFLLTQPEKKVKSGTMSRLECYNIIKADKEMQNECKKLWGRSYTQVSTNELIAFIESYSNKQESCECPNKFNNLVEAFKMLVDELNCNMCLEDEQCSSILEVLEGNASEKMTQKDIDEMFDFVK